MTAAAPPRAAIQNVLGRAAWGYDENDVDLLAAQFTEDAVMSMRIGREGDLIGPFEGRPAIRALHADSLAAQTDQRRHNLSNLFLEHATAEEVTAISNLTLLSVRDGAVRLLSSGWYRDRMVLRDDVWLISDRYLYLDLPY